MTILDESAPGDVLVGDVDTPDFAPWPSRVVAALLDSAILTATAFVVDGSLDSVTWWISYSSDGRAPLGRGVIAAFVVLLLTQAVTGATPGKRIVGIRVVREGGARAPGVLRTALRAAAHVIDAFCYLGYLRPLVHPRRRTVADSAAATDVVFDRPGARPGGVDVWTLSAMAVCSVAIGFSVGGMTTYGGETNLPCVAADESQVNVYVPPTPSTTRFGVTRTGHPTVDLSATWTYPPGTVPPDLTTLTSTVTAEDGSWAVSRETQVAVDPGAADAEGVWTVAIPADDLGRVGDDWTWRAEVTPPDGADAVEVCSLTHASG